MKITTMSDNREHIARQAQHFEPDPGSVTPSSASAEVRRQARAWAAYDRHGQQTRTAFPSAWFVAVAIAALTMGAALSLPFHTPIEIPAHCGTC